MRSLGIRRAWWSVLLACVVGCGGLPSEETRTRPERADDSNVDAATDDEDDDGEPRRMRVDARDGGASVAGRAGSGGQGGRAPMGGRGGGGVDSDAEPAPKADSRAEESGPVASGTAAECGDDLTAPATQCFAADRAEPNDKASPATLQLEPNCGYVAANLAAGEEDAYTFSPEKSDPVRIQLAYTTADVSDLELRIRAPNGDILTTERDARTAPREDLGAIIQTTAAAQYMVEVAATSGKALCQSYALRVDPYWCTDRYEDNDVLERATKLAWDDEERATAEGTLSSADNDYFEVTTVRADPVLLTGEYHAEPGETIGVRRTVYDATGASVVDQVGDRETDVEMFSHWLQAKSAGTVLRARLWPSGSGCAPYKVSFDAHACTDDFEDNDTPETAAMLPIGRDVQVTGSNGDQDHYKIDALVDGGSCSIRYAIPAGRSQQLRVEVYNVAGSQVTNALGGELVGTERQMKLTWAAGRGVSRIRVQPDNGGYCQPYTIRCEHAAGQ